MNMTERRDGSRSLNEFPKSKIIKPEIAEVMSEAYTITPDEFEALFGYPFRVRAKIIIPHYLDRMAEISIPYDILKGLAGYRGKASGLHQIAYERITVYDVDDVVVRVPGPGNISPVEYDFTHSWFDQGKKTTKWTEDQAGIVTDQERGISYANCNDGRLGEAVIRWQNADEVERVDYGYKGLM